MIKIVIIYNYLIIFNYLNRLNLKCWKRFENSDPKKVKL